MGDSKQTLEARTLGALPLINHFLQRLRLRDFFGRALPVRSGRRPSLPPADALCVFVRNMLVCRHPLYRLPEWAAAFVPSFLGLRPDQSQLLNDDRIGRCLDIFFESDRATFLTSFLTHMVREFHLDLKVLHNDSTSVRFTGRYPRRKPGTLWILHGHSKDHRPDLRQIIFELTVSEDGAVPILVALHNGNVTDDQTHRENWDRLCELVGRVDFIYVADCKLCVSETLLHITRKGGHFVTILPARRKEEGWFKEWIQTHSVDWQEVWVRPATRRQGDSPDRFEGFESPLRSAEGYRILWYHSSAKHERDQEFRQGRIRRAIADLEFLKTKTGAYKLKTESQVKQAADKILERLEAQRWIEVTVQMGEKDSYRQKTRGRPGPDTEYRKLKKPWPELSWRVREDTVAWDAKTDGLFPLMTDMDPQQRADFKQVLFWYKYQPRLEKRFEQLKSVFEVRPVFLKKVERVEAFLILYFITLIVESLIERELRKGMREARIEALPLYPERRRCKAPTAERVMELFEGIRRHRLFEGGEEVNRFQDELTPLQRQVGTLLNVPLRVFDQ